ncbi:Dihydroxy-acid dehydratase [Trichinella spiralis]|uniref:Dihydroxy-acid dehydratase n=1 Tax=Trichinella spiralis TaxID=6334 RepID=A0ABR3KJ12_TRISP
MIHRVLTSYPVGHAALEVHNFGVPESKAVDQVRIHLDLLADNISSVRTQHSSVHIRIQPDTVCSFRKCRALHSVPKATWMLDKNIRLDTADSVLCKSVADQSVIDMTVNCIALVISHLVNMLPILWDNLEDDLFDNKCIEKSTVRSHTLLDIDEVLDRNKMEHSLTVSNKLAYQKW